MGRHHISVMPVLIAASLMLSLAMGLRQSLGIVMPPLVADIPVTVTQFTLAIAIQNLVWGLLQPIAGMIVGRSGFRPVMMIGSACYVVGLAMLAMANGSWFVTIGAGFLVGAAMAMSSVTMAMSITTRVISPAKRSMALGIVSAAGSLGALFSAPIGQGLVEAFTWREGVWGFAALAVIMLPAAWIAGRVDRMDLPAPVSQGADDLSARNAIRMAMANPRYLTMGGAFFVCGMQLIFLTTHLPSYLVLCGMDPMLSATALGTIGGFNILGSLFFGWAGGRWNREVLLGLIYVGRSIVLAWYFVTPPTPESTVIFAALMGFLWLGVSPLVAGTVAALFGLRWQPMLQGFMFFNHQIGSFAGAFGGGWLFQHLGSYDLAVKLGVGLGLTAGIVQILVPMMFRDDPAQPAPA